MTNPMFNPQPNYSGVTIQISNPAVNVNPFDNRNMQQCGSNCGANTGYGNVRLIPNNSGYINYPQGSYANYGGENTAYNSQLPLQQYPNEAGSNPQQLTNEYVSNPVQPSGFQNAYPAQYYMNNYNYGVPSTDIKDTNNDRQIQNTQHSEEEKHSSENRENERMYISDKNNNTEAYNNAVNNYKIYSDENKSKNNDLTKSQNIIDDLAQREEEIQEEKKNTKETKIVALTDEYIKSLENYLNNPNDEIRLMASKEILTRLDEDKDRYDDAALNALLNKMLQDPNKLVRIASLSAFASQLASGNDYTVKLLHDIQSNPNADKEDILQAADILLKMSAGVEVKNIPNPSAKNDKK